MSAFNESAEVLVVQIIFRPRFSCESVAIRRDDPSLERAEAATARWGDLFGGSVTRDADFEDFHENAAQLFAAIDSGHPVFAMERHSHAIARTFNTDEAAPDPTEPTLLIGCTIRNDPYQAGAANVQWPSAGRGAAASAYWRNPAFARHAGRQVAVAGFPEDALLGSTDPNGVIAVMQRLAGAGETSLLLKAIGRDKLAAPETVRIDDPQDRRAMASRLIRAFEYTLMSLEGRSEAFLVQEKIAMENEYRVLVVDGVPVAGAGCIHHYCPPYNDGVAFHPAVQRRRPWDGSPEPVVEDAALVARYEEAATTIMGDLLAHDPAMTDLTLDLATNEKGDIVVVEANPLTGNWGLYALDYGRVLAAMVEAVEQRCDTGLRRGWSVVPGF